MLPEWHLLLGAIFSLLLWPILGPGVLIILVVSILIDIDHYFLYVKMTKNYNPLKSYSFLKKVVASKKLLRKYGAENMICLFHTIEFWLLLLLVGFYYHTIFSLMFIGVMFHMAVDFSYRSIRTNWRSKWYEKLSLVWWLLRVKNKRKFINKKS